MVEHVCISLVARPHKTQLTGPMSWAVFGGPEKATKFPEGQDSSR